MEECTPISSAVTSFARDIPNERNARGCFVQVIGTESHRYNSQYPPPCNKRHIIVLKHSSPQNFVILHFPNSQGPGNTCKASEGPLTLHLVENHLVCLKRGSSLPPKTIINNAKAGSTHTPTPGDNSYHHSCSQTGGGQYWPPGAVKP